MNNNTAIGYAIKAARDDTDILNYINSRNCPYSELYDLTDKDGNKLVKLNGCYTCGTGLDYEGNNIEILRKQNGGA